jgi:hypothetical protein
VALVLLAQLLAIGGAMRLEAMALIALRSGCVVILAAILNGCQPVQPALPVTGEISLKLAPTAGASMHFILTNQSSRILSMRGSYKKRVGAIPWDAWMECLESAINEWTEGPYANVDGAAATLEIGVGEQLDVILGFDHHRKFVQDYKGGRCKLNLKLMDGTVVTSDEFRP